MIYFLICSSGHHDNIGGQYPTQPANMNLNVSVQLESPSFPPNQLISTVQQSQPSSGIESILALGPPHSTSPSFPTNAASNLTSYRALEDIPEDEIRVRSHEMLEHDDMQHLLRMFSMGGNGHASFNANDNNFSYSTYNPFSPPSFTFGEDRTRSSGKAVVGWLKLKAALRWGIFIRKKAAERRAQIVELDDY